jgi:sigma-E processing peptidase SpoIIGA
VEEVGMKIEIYWDSLFLMNMLINWGVLKLLQKRFAISANNIRMGIASFVGGVAYVIVLICWEGNGICQLLATLCSVVLVACIYLEKRKRWLLKKVCIYGLLYTFVISGVLRVVLKQFQHMWRRTVSAEWILIGVFLCVKIGEWYIEREQKEKRRSLHSVILESAGAQISVKALLDTGNRLVEPISGKPVCIVDEEILAKLTLENPLFFRAIPFRSVGCEHGMVYGVQIPKIHIEEEGKTYIITDVVCAGTGHKLSARNEYQMIIHPGVLVEKNK